jgi:hypothetical protein
MDLLILTSIVVGGLALIGLAATRLGYDSRDPMTDDHQRCNPGSI